MDDVAPSFDSFPPTFDSFPAPPPSPSRAPHVDEQRARKRRKISPADDQPRREKKAAKRAAKRDRQLVEPSSKAEESSKDAADDFLDSLLPKEPSTDHPQDSPRHGVLPHFRIYPIPTKPITPKSAHPLETRPIVVDVTALDEAVRHGLESKQVSRFRRNGGGYVLGLDGRHRIPKPFAASRKEVPVLPRHPNQYLRYTDKTARHRLTDPKFRRLLVRPDLGTSIEAQDSFVQLEISTAVAQVVREQEGDQDYRSVAGMAVEGDDSEDDDPLADDVLDGQSRGETILQRNADFEKRLRAAPNDVDLWLSFVEYTSAQHDPTDASSRHAASEVRLSKLQRALAIAGNERDERLHLARMHAMTDIWPTDRILAAWQSLLARCPDSTAFLLAYVDFRSTSAATFSKDGVLNVYIECMQSLGGLANDHKLDSRQRSDIESNLVYLFLRACTFLRQAGHRELAIGAFQAQIELNLFMPDHIRSTSTALAELEDFWDLEAPRIGEAGAKGWRNTSLDCDVPSPQSAPSSLREDDLQPWSDRWSAAERHAAASSARPSRTADDSDPFSLIAFADFKRLLCIFRSSSAQLELVYSFLAFLGIPFLPPAIPSSTLSSLDAFLNTSLAENRARRAKFWPVLETSSKPFATLDGIAMDQERQSGLRDPHASPFKTFPLTKAELFSTPGRWTSFVDSGDLVDVDVDMARADHIFRLHSLCLESVAKPKAAAKLAKSYVAADQTNLALYEAYARSEAARGNIDKARSTFAQALTGLSGHEEARDAWWAWAELEWLECKVEVAVEILAASVAPAHERDLDSLTLAKAPAVRMHGVRDLKTRKAFERHLTEADHGPQRIALIDAFALFLYITRGLEFACDLYEHELENIAASSTALVERLWTGYAKMLYRHSSSRSDYRPVLLRSVLERALAVFPVNSIFLSLYAWNESRMRIHNRVRTLLDRQLDAKATSSAPAWLFRIYIELHLQTNSFSVHAVRDLFERAVHSLGATPSSAAWALFIEFETRFGEIDRAKSLVFRAVQQCPWVKDLYLLAFAQPLASAFEQNELVDLFQLMQEYGLRLRVDLRPYLPKGDEVKAIAGPAQQAIEDWEVTELAEREKRKPLY